MENKRLTTKCDSDEYIVGVTTNGGYDEDAVLEKQYEANNKLGKLEDLEELLGFSLTEIDIESTNISSLSTSIDATTDNEIYFCADDFYGTYPVEDFQEIIKRILIESIIALKQIKKDKSE